MKQKTMYECEFCGKTFKDKETCEGCEAIHFGITRREYLDWRILNKEAADAGKRMGTCNNKNTRRIFDEAIKKLVAFEANHGIKSDCKKPTDFYF